MDRGGGARVLGCAALLAGLLAVGLAAPAGADSLPSKLSAAAFYKLVSHADPLKGPSQSQFSTSFGLGDGSSMTEGFSGRGDPKNGEEMLTTSMSISTNGASEKIESIQVECFHESCYTSGNVIGIPLTGETGAKWLAVTVPKVKPIYNPFTALAKRFSGSVHETKLPLSAPHSAGGAYLVSGSFTELQLIEVFSSVLPSGVGSLTKDPQESAALNGIVMSFHNALAIVSPTGRLIGLRMPITITVSPSAMGALGASSGPTTASGTLDGANTAAPALHLVRPAAASTTTSAAVAQSFKTSPSGATGSTGNTGSIGTSGNTGNSGSFGSGSTPTPPDTGNSGIGLGNSGTGNSGTSDTVPSTTNSGTGNSGIGNSGSGNSGIGNSGSGNSGNT